MNLLTRPVLTAAIAVASVLFAHPLIAQVPEASVGGQAASANGDATPDLTLAQVEAALASLEADTGIKDAVKELLGPKYTQAIDALKESADFVTKAKDYGEAIEAAPDEAAKSREQLKALPSADSAAEVTATGDAKDLQKDIDLRRAALNGLNNDLASTTSELARVKGRPVEIIARLAAAERELPDIRKQLASPELAQDATSPGRVADRILLQAFQSRLIGELEMLKQEQLSLSVREDLLQARHALLTRQVENSAASLNALDALLQQRLSNEANQVSSLTNTLLRDLPKGDQAAQELADEVKALAKEFEDVVENLRKVKAAEDDVASRLKDLTAEYESISEQLELGGGGRAIAQVLFELHAHSLAASAYVSTIQLPTLDETRLASFQVKEKLRRQPEVGKQFADPSSDAVSRLVAARLEVLEKLRMQYGNLIRALAVLDGDKRQYHDKAEEVRDYVSEQLYGFGIRSCPPISLKTLTDIPGGLRWTFGGDHWRELGSALLETPARMPVCSFGIVLVVVMLLLARRRIGAALGHTGVKIRRISTARYTHTGEALVWTVLLAIPIPLALGFAGWALGQTPKPSDWMRGIAFGLQMAARITLASEFLAAVCRPGGLGTAHFGWRKETLARFRRAVHLFTIVYIPMLLLTFSSFYGDASEYFESIGTISFILAQTWTAVILWRLFHPSVGVIASLAREHPTHWLTRWRYVWFSLMLACPIALILVGGWGYLITAIQLSFGLVVTVALIAVGFVLHGLALRWFTMKHRKLALAEALDRRRERQEAAASEDRQEPTGEVVSIDPEDEEEMDLESISEQTSALLRLLSSLGVAVAIILFWSGTFPLIAVLRGVPLIGGLTLLGLIQAALILVVTYFAVQNLPGLLELAVLRATTIDAGTRNAITTLCQYVLVAIGLVVLFNVLKVDWAQFGWMAAALSVGLGFGLQEVVANFVCGLILLFERPIRVGDVVTVEGMTGTVTQIHLRATTIINWDRQEFVVPNKILITNTLLNWTLSAPVNRTIITVGVAYASDTEKALQILLDVAADHPRVLDDPPPQATFEQFAESSLTLSLRVYLPDLDNRMGTITDLHTEINKRFAAAGIEIAFPQQDLHLRSGWNDPRRTGSDAAEDG
jgi:small-conductance mechanosensitive channel